MSPHGSLWLCFYYFQAPPPPSELIWKLPGMKFPFRSKTLFIKNLQGRSELIWDYIHCCSARSHCRESEELRGPITKTFLLNEKKKHRLFVVVVLISSDFRETSDKESRRGTLPFISCVVRWFPQSFTPDDSKLNLCTKTSKYLNWRNNSLLNIYLSNNLLNLTGV